jgi:ectoine hydroxylase-related dioxygenase (phytanoyl-CoA dioxygenase family)
MIVDNSLHERFWTRGYVVLRAFFAPTLIERCGEELARLLASGAHEDPLNLRYESRRTVGAGSVVDRIDPVLDLVPSLRELAMHAELASALHTAMGEPTSLLMAKLIIKRPGTAGYMAHQDFLYWRWLELDPDKLCSVAVALGDNEEGSGNLKLYPGMHRELIRANEHDPSGDIAPSLLANRVSECPSLQRGDVIVFHSLTPHESAANASTRDRNLLIASYAAVSERGLYRRYYEREMARRLESYRSGRGNEALIDFARAQDSFDARMHRS